MLFLEELETLTRLCANYRNATNRFYQILRAHHGTLINVLGAQQNYRHFADDILKFMLLNENVCIFIQIPLKFVSEGTVDNMSALDQVFLVLDWTAWLNKIWWLCLVSTSTTWFASDVGYRMAKNLIELYKEIIFMNNDI